MPDLNVHVRHLFSSEGDQEAVRRAAGDCFSAHTPVSFVFGLIEIMGFLLSP